MGRVLALAPELRALGNTKAMLFVDDHKTEAGELNGIFNDGMGAHEDMNGAIEESFEYLLATLTLDNARQQGDAKVHSLEELHDGSQMLLGKNLCGGHDTGLVTIVDGDEHGHQGYEGLA